jgi:hypothetical protein
MNSLLKNQHWHFWLNKMDFFSQMKKKKEVKEPQVKKVQSPEVLQVCLRIDMKKKEINTEFKEKKR